MNPKTMKTIVASLLLLSTSSLMAQQGQPVSDASKSISATYTQGVLAMNRGEVIEAEKAFRAILRVQPDHPHARFQLNQLLTNRDKIAALSRENTMKKTMLAQIDYSDASLAECLESLTILINEANKKQFTPNFIVKDPQGKLKDKTVTLKLSNIPASQALQYIASATSCKISYEEHAIVMEAK